MGPELLVNPKIIMAGWVGARYKHHLIK